MHSLHDHIHDINQRLQVVSTCTSALHGITNTQQGHSETALRQTALHGMALQTQTKVIKRWRCIQCITLHGTANTKQCHSKMTLHQAALHCMALQTQTYHTEPLAQYTVTRYGYADRKGRRCAA